MYKRWLAVFAAIVAAMLISTPVLANGQGGKGHQGDSKESYSQFVHDDDRDRNDRDRHHNDNDRDQHDRHHHDNDQGDHNKKNRPPRYHPTPVPTAEPTSSPEPVSTPVPVQPTPAPIQPELQPVAQPAPVLPAPVALLVTVVPPPAPVLPAPVTPPANESGSGGGPKRNLCPTLPPDLVDSGASDEKSRCLLPQLYPKPYLDSHWSKLDEWQKWFAGFSREPWTGWQIMPPSSAPAPATNIVYVYLPAPLDTSPTTVQPVMDSSLTDQQTELEAPAGEMPEEVVEEEGEIPLVDTP